MSRSELCSYDGTGGCPVPALSNSVLLSPAESCWVLRICLLIGLPSCGALDSPRVGERWRRFRIGAPGTLST